jgi:hypothetical protein
MLFFMALTWQKNKAAKRQIFAILPKTPLSLFFFYLIFIVAATPVCRLRY